MMQQSANNLKICIVDGTRRIVVKCRNKSCKKNEESIKEINNQPIAASRIDNSVNDVEQSNVQANSKNSKVNIQFGSGVKRKMIDNKVHVKNNQSISLRK